MDGRSTTLYEIGFIDYLEREEGIEYLNGQIRRIDDDEQRRKARRETIMTGVFFDSPNAIASSGEIVGVDGKVRVSVCGLTPRRARPRQWTERDRSRARRRDGPGSNGRLSTGRRTGMEGGESR